MTGPGRSAAQPLAGRRALVTGASGGIGRATALALGGAGAAVTLVARRPAELAEVAEAVAAAGGTSTIRELDVTDATAVGAMLDELPPHDVIVNSAGTNRPLPFLEVDLETYDRLFDLNVRALFVVTQHAVRRLRAEDRPGVVINISSQMGHVGAPTRTVYCATKHAVEGLTKALAVELAPYGIRAVSVAPTFVETALTRPMFDDPAFRTAVFDSIPLRRLATPEDVASAVLFLAGDGAAMVTGTSLVVDGGWTAR